MAIFERSDNRRATGRSGGWFMWVVSSIVLLFLLVTLIVYALLKRSEYETHIRQLQSEDDRVKEAEVAASRYQAEIANLNQQLSRFEKISHVPGIIDRAKTLKAEIEARTQKAHEEYEALRASLIQKAKEEARADKSDTKIKKAQAEEALVAALAEADQIIEAAREKAKKIAGDAAEAMAKVDFYTKTAEAMYNVTKGYGDRYMTPSTSILDEWADQYSFDEAGTKLKLARDRVRLMESNRLAARCEYAKADRRELAINFVLDAFNGNVDSILSRIKHDNYGKLQQEMRDAFQIVNFNGSAFRDTRISDEYLDARLNELRCAEVVQQLRIKEREEQRAIQEKIREEAKARREFERAIKQAERDEKLINDSIDKVRLQYQTASADERAKYEARLADLDQKLKEMEERTQRAQSMAQQTKCGYVYVISNIGSFGEEVFKIGMTRRLEPSDRVRELGDASVPFSFDIHAMIYSNDAPSLEYTLHKRFVELQVNKANRRKEFFRVSVSDIRKIVEEMGLQAHWTIAAEALEYRETQAIEKRLQEDPAFRKQWLEDQSAYIEPEFDEDLMEQEASEASVS